MIMTGLTGIGQGAKGGHGIILDDGHPRHIDFVAARYPELRVLAARPAYPWQDEMIAVLLHKANVASYELHGWGPRQYSPALKKAIAGRLADRVMFGCDFPVLRYEKVMADWNAEGYSREVLEKVLYRNARLTSARNRVETDDVASMGGRCRRACCRFAARGAGAAVSFAPDRTGGAVPRRRRGRRQRPHGGDRERQPGTAGGHPEQGRARPARSGPNMSRAPRQTATRCWWRPPRRMPCCRPTARDLSYDTVSSFERRPRCSPTFPNLLVVNPKKVPVAEQSRN